MCPKPWQAVVVWDFRCGWCQLSGAVCAGRGAGGVLASVISRGLAQPGGRGLPWEGLWPPRWNGTRRASRESQHRSRAWPGLGGIPQSPSPPGSSWAPAQAPPGRTGHGGAGPATPQLCCLSRLQRKRPVPGLGCLKGGIHKGEVPFQWCRMLSVVRTGQLLA